MEKIISLISTKDSLQAFLNAMGDPILEHYRFTPLFPSLIPPRIRFKVSYLKRTEDNGKHPSRVISAPIPLGWKLF